MRYLLVLPKARERGAGLGGSLVVRAEVGFQPTRYLGGGDIGSRFAQPYAGMILAFS